MLGESRYDRILMHNFEFNGNLVELVFEEARVKFLLRRRMFPTKKYIKVDRLLTTHVHFVMKWTKIFIRLHVLDIETCWRILTMKIFEPGSVSRYTFGVCKVIDRL